MYCLLSFCLLLSAGSYGQELIFKAHLRDADTMMIVFRSISGSDTINTTNGHFTFRKKLPFPQLYTIICVRNQQSIAALRDGNERGMRSIADGVSREVFFENGTASLSGNFADFGSMAIVREHTAMQKLYDEFRKRFNPLVKVARTIIDSSYSKGATQADKKIFTMLYNRVEQVENETAEKFAAENAGNAVGAYVLYRYYKTNSRDHLDSLYRLFPVTLRASGYLRNIHDRILALSALQPGRPVPHFAGITHEQRKFSLQDAKGKYAVLDFWGSWCTPCIKGIPKMKEYYNKYKDKINFIGIACNDQRDAWKNAITRYELPWIQLFNDDTLSLVSKYNIEAYPTKILIDQDGKFIQAFVGEDNAFYDRVDALMAAGNN